jgi:hypothetical protein
MSIRGNLYILQRVKWDEALANLDLSYVTARFEISPGWILGRAQWPNAEARDHWLKSTQALEVDDFELDDATRERISLHHPM